MGAEINSIFSDKDLKLKPIPIKKAAAVDPKIFAENAVLINSDDRYVLYGKGETNPVPIASVTKVMTAMVALDIYKLNDVIEIKKDFIDINGSVAGLKAGEKITAENLLYCLLTVSGNDAAKTLANAKISQVEFVDLMNKKAESLGMESTKYKDPAGLDDQGRSSAKDIAILFSLARKNPTFAKIVATGETQVSSVDGSVTHDLKNSNRLTTGEIPLDGVEGGKTGFTPDAGHTLVTAAQKGNTTLIAVVLKTTSNAPEASAIEVRKLLTWGFDSFDFPN